MDADRPPGELSGCQVGPLPDMQQGRLGDFLAFACVSTSIRFWLRSGIISIWAWSASRLRPALRSAAPQLLHTLEVRSHAATVPHVFGPTLTHDHMQEYTWPGLLQRQKALQPVAAHVRAVLETSPEGPAASGKLQRSWAALRCLHHASDSPEQVLGHELGRILGTVWGVSHLPHASWDCLWSHPHELFSGCE